MEPFVAALEAFHERTAPGDWLEGLVKAYVGDGIAEDFYREVSAYLDDSTRDLVLAVLEDTGHSAFAVERVRAAIEADPRLAGRLALWGRRLVGEALTQAQRVAAERDALATLLVGGITERGADLAEVGRMFARLTETHTKRMAASACRPDRSACAIARYIAPKPTRRLSGSPISTYASLSDGHHDLPAALVGQREHRRPRR